MAVCDRCRDQSPWFRARGTGNLRPVDGERCRVCDAVYHVFKIFRFFSGRWSPTPALESMGRSVDIDDDQ